MLKKPNGEYVVNDLKILRDLLFSLSLSPVLRQRALWFREHMWTDSFNSLWHPPAIKQGKQTNPAQWTLLLTVLLEFRKVSSFMTANCRE